MESSTTILADLGDIVASRVDEYDKLAGYEAFRRIKDNFEEPPRPSIHDVESVASILADAMGHVASQNGYTVRTYEPVESPLPATRVGSQLAGQGGLQNSTDEGRTHRISISPGIIRRRTFDAARLEATQQRQIEARLKLAVGWLGIPFALPDEEKTVGAEIQHWSAKSRVRMLETVASLDYSEWLRTEGTLAMVTLTLPGNWQVLTPDGATFKKFIEKFRRRWVRATGLPWRLLWKLEFQGRGAPHWHALMRVPVFVKGRIFTEWLSETWADVVDASKTVDRWEKGADVGSSEYSRHVAAGTAVDFSGKDFSDPRRISQYFLGHSAKTTDGKEYQHDVPELWQEKGKGPGRFWGYCGLDKAVVELDVTEAQKVLLDRQLRKIKRARDWKVNVLREQGTAKRTGARIPAAHEVNVPKAKKSAGRAKHRTANRRARLAAHPRMEGPLRYSNKPAELIMHGPLPAWAWEHQKRARYAPFSRGQGGFVLVNDALRLGLDLAAYLRSCV